MLLKTAQEKLAKNQDVLIVNLDIKDFFFFFFYSVRIDSKEFGALASGSTSIKNLNLIFEQIHKLFTIKLLKTQGSLQFLHRGPRGR